MSADETVKCRRAACARVVPRALAGERLCLDHFLDEAFHRADYALECCHHGRPLGPGEVEWLLADALAVVENLEEQADDPQPQPRDRMLELLLILANLQEYVAGQSTQMASRPSNRPAPPA